MAEMVLAVAVAGAFLAFVLYVACRPRTDVPDDRDQDAMGPNGPIDPIPAFRPYRRCLIGADDGFRRPFCW